MVRKGMDQLNWISSMICIIRENASYEEELKLDSKFELSLSLSLRLRRILKSLTDDNSKNKKKAKKNNVPGSDS